MALWQGKSRRKTTGGRYRPQKGKRKAEIGREQQITVVGSLECQTDPGTIAVLIYSFGSPPIYETLTTEIEDPDPTQTCD